VLTSLGWYLSCNKPCDPEYITVKGDTVFLQPEPISVISVNDKSDTIPKKGGLMSFFSGKKNHHKVKEGENMYRIGLKYGIPAITLQALNKRPNFDIKAGEWLYIGTPKERDSALAQLKADSIYTYEKEFGDKSVKGRVITQSTGPMLSQSIYFESLAEKPKNRLFLGGSIDRTRTLSGMAGYELKSGWLITGQYGVIGTNNVQIGVMKRLK